MRRPSKHDRRNSVPNVRRQTDSVNTIEEDTPHGRREAGTIYRSMGREGDSQRGESQGGLRDIQEQWSMGNALWETIAKNIQCYVFKQPNKLSTDVKFKCCLEVVC